MTDRRDNVQATLRRLLANGRLTAIPKSPADQQVLLALAASRFDPAHTYLERDVNELLKRWLETISEPYGIDHVTFRRMLVDSGLLNRTSSGSTYRIDPARLGEFEALGGVDSMAILAEVKREREERKRRHAS